MVLATAAKSLQGPCLSLYNYGTWDTLRHFTVLHITACGEKVGGAYPAEEGNGQQKYGQGVDRRSGIERSGKDIADIELEKRTCTFGTSEGNARAPISGTEMHTQSRRA